MTFKFKGAAMAGLLALIGMSSQANAALVFDSWSDVKTWTPGLSIPPTRTFTHSLATFNPYASSIYAWALTLDLVDDGNGSCSDGQCESVTVRVNGSVADTYANYTLNTWWGPLHLGWNFDTQTEIEGGLGSPLSGGVMTVRINANYGDVVLRGSKLDAVGQTETTKVPEPGTLGLLGLGLLGAGLLRRRTAFKA